MFSKPAFKADLQVHSLTDLLLPILPYIVIQAILFNELSFFFLQMSSNQERLFTVLYYIECVIFIFI